MKKKRIVENDKSKILATIEDLDQKKNQALNIAWQKVLVSQNVIPSQGWRITWAGLHWEQLSVTWVRPVLTPELKPPPLLKCAFVLTQRNTFMSHPHLSWLLLSKETLYSPSSVRVLFLLLEENLSALQHLLPTQLLHPESITPHLTAS